ncbi:MAG: hypothetical protein VCA34_06470 [Roseibacillus sp.]
MGPTTTDVADIHRARVAFEFGTLADAQLRVEDPLPGAKVVTIERDGGDHEGRVLSRLEIGAD